MRKSLKLLVVTVAAGALAFWLSQHSGIGWGLAASYAAMGAFVAAIGAVVYWLNEDGKGTGK